MKLDVYIYTRQLTLVDLAEQSHAWETTVEVGLEPRRLDLDSMLALRVRIAWDGWVEDEDPCASEYEHWQPYETGMPSLQSWEV